MNKEFEAIITFCSNFEYSEFNKLLKVYPLNVEVNLTLNSIFKNPMNHFNILTKKILNHENTRVKKYFVKFFCKLDGIKSNFKEFVLGTFFRLINIPVFYNEADYNTYHSKIGMLVQKFYERFLESNKHNVIIK